MTRAGTETVAAVLLAATAAFSWLLFAPRTPDLAAQIYRADLFSAHGFVLYDPAWYAGHDVPGYSLIVPALSSLLGTRVLGALVAVVSALCFERLVVGALGDRARWAARWFAVATVADLLIGRVTYACGVALGIAALLAWQRRRPRVALTLAVLCAAASPVTGAFLAIAGASLSLDRRRLAPALALAAAPVATVAAIETAFPEGGRQPFPLAQLLVLVGLGAVTAAVMPARLRIVRIALWLYLVAAVAIFAVASPMGSNIERLGAGLYGPALLLAVAVRRDGDVGRRGALLALVAVAGIFQWWSPVHEVAKGVDEPAFTGAYYQPLVAYLHRQGPVTGRIEVPFTRAHWEAEALAPRLPLARGWERQLDTRYATLFYDDELGPRAYERWLRAQAVRFVAVPDAPLDFAGRAEAQLIARRPAFLRPVWRSRHWRVFAVRHPAALISGPATLLAAGPDRVVLRVRRAARLTLRLRWTALWEVEGAGACVAPGPGGFTTVRTARPGVVRLGAELSVDGLLRRTTGCSGRSAA